MEDIREAPPLLGGLRAWFTVSCGAIFYCYQFIIRVFPNVLSEEIMQAFAIDAAAFGVIIGFFYWTYSGMQVPIGITVDKIGPRRLLTIAGLVCGAACFIFALTTNPVIAGASRFMMGLGAACGLLGTMKLGTLWFPPHKIGNVIALTIAFGTIGAALGGPPLSYLSDLLGWQNALSGLGLVGLLISIITYLFVRNSPSGDILPKSYDDQKLFTGLKLVAKSPQAWIISLFGMLMYAPMIVMGDAWLTPFIETVYPIEEKVAATIHTSLFIGAAIGAPIFTSISDRLASRLIPMFIGAIACLTIYSIIVFTHGVPIALMYVLFFSAGFCYTSKCLCFACMTEIVPQNASGVSIGFTNMIVMMFGAALHPTVGYMVKYHSNGLIVKGTPIYSEADYRFAFIILPICLAISVFLIAFMKETHPGRRSGS